jgi:PucR C-terminal helix-turn-helix domain/GAF domain/GGDEF-like domain
VPWFCPAQATGVRGPPQRAIEQPKTDEDAVKELWNVEAIPAKEFTAPLGNAGLYAEYRRLAAEQAALRRLAALVASGAEPSEVFDAVTKEMVRCVPAEGAGLWRYETNGEVTMVAAAYHAASSRPQWPVGSRTPIAGDTLASRVQRTGEPARMDSYENVAGEVATHVRAVGIRAAVGVPVFVDGRMWGLAAVGCGRPGPMPADTEARISGFAELIASVLVAGYRDEQKRQMLGETTRPVLMDSLLEGRALDDWSVCQVAGNLGLPSKGSYVVIAAEYPTMGSEPLPDIKSKLRSLDVYSAWRLLPDVQVGIAHVTSEQLDKVVALLSRIAVHRVGVSARFKDLRDTPHALHFAKVMMGGRTNGTFPVAVFDGSILATAAVSAPEVMVKSAGTALDPFSGLPDEEREMLFETFRVWQDNDASISASAERLFCHPNTVRHRLRRIEKHTGRSLSRPRDVAELCLAFEVWRRLM